MLSKDLEQTITKAMHIAAEHAHEFATLEHLLMAMTEDPDALDVLRACQVNVDELKMIVKFISKMSLIISYQLSQMAKFNRPQVSSVLFNAPSSIRNHQTVMWQQAR